MGKQRIFKPVEQILELCEDHGFVVVSYGLAPNPNGFCFEDPGEESDFEGDHQAYLYHQETKSKLSRLLSGLNEAAENQLREIIFGGENE